jgi:hypothetical protein
MVNEFRVGTTVETKKGSVLLHKHAAHPCLHCLKNIHVEFLPPSTIYLVKTVDMRITQHLKTLYHRNLVNYILEATEEKLAISPTAREVSARVYLSQGIQFVTDSWQ